MKLQILRFLNEESPPTNSISKRLHMSIENGLSLETFLVACALLDPSEDQRFLVLEDNAKRAEMNEGLKEMLTLLKDIRRSRLVFVTENVSAVSDESCRKKKDKVDLDALPWLQASSPVVGDGQFDLPTES